MSERLFELRWREKRVVEFERLQLGIGLYLFDDHSSLNILGVWIRLGRAWREPHETLEKWGVTAYLTGSDGFGRCVHFGWGRHTWILDLPWSWGSNWRHEVLTASGNWVTASDEYHWSDPRRHLPDGRQEQQFPYRYVCRDGTVQDVTATVYVEEREWRWRLFRWLWPIPGPRLTHRCISVQFSDEVGERRGSWKGGCTGCGYEMLPGEDAEQCLRRMERERRFDR